MFLRFSSLFFLVFLSFFQKSFAEEQGNKIYTVSPDEIKKFKKRFKNVERAIHNEPEPEMVNLSLPVSLLPGDKVQRLCLVPGYVSTITIVDSTGEPWPIMYEANPNEAAFKVSRPINGELNLLSISALRNHKTANIALTLQGEDVPIHIVVTSRKKFCKSKLGKTNKKRRRRRNRIMDANRTLLVGKRGPNAKTARVGKSIGPTSDSVIYDVLNQIPPKGSVALSFGVLQQSLFLLGWEINDHYYILTSGDLVNPAYDQIAMQGELRVYRIPPIDMLFISIDGKPTSIGISRSKQLAYREGL